MSLTDSIRTFIADELTSDPRAPALTDEELLLERGILDSLGLLRVLSFLESEYHVTIPDEEVVPENFESVTAIAALVRRHRNGDATA